MCREEDSVAFVFNEIILDLTWNKFINKFVNAELLRRNVVVSLLELLENFDQTFGMFPSVDKLSESQESIY